MLGLQKHQRAFTLIEMGIVIAVIGILSSMAMLQTEGMDASTEDALLEDYLQKLNAGAATYLETVGEHPPDFQSFMAVDQAGLDADNGILVPLLYNKNNKPLCGTAVPSLNSLTLTCNGSALLKRKATYILAAGMVSVVIMPK